MKIISRVVGAGLVPGTGVQYAIWIATGIGLAFLLWVAVVLMYGGWEIAGGR